MQYTVRKLFRKNRKATNDEKQLNKDLVWFTRNKKYSKKVILSLTRLDKYIKAADKEAFNKQRCSPIDKRVNKRGFNINYQKVIEQM